MYSLKTIFLLTLPLFLLSFSLQASFKKERLKEIDVYQDGAYVDVLGYHNTDLATNGEDGVIRLIRAGDVVFDIGGCKGEWSGHLLANQPSARLWVFEPQQPLLDFLKNFFQSHPVQLSPFALSDAKGNRSLVHYPDYPELSSFYQRPEAEAEPVFLTVQTERLDHFCEESEVPFIDFINIKTGGHEWAVLLGAHRLLQKQAIGAIQFDYGPCYLNSETSLRQVYDYLTSFDYSIYRIIPQGLIYIDQWRSELENFSCSHYLAIKNH